MKWTALLITLIMVLSLCASAQQVQYSTGSSGGAPTPIAPQSPETLGLQTPSPTTSTEAPSPQEQGQMLFKVDQAAAYSAPQGALMATGTSPTYTRMVVPTGTYAPNQLYVSYAPQTIAGCNMYANLPLWMQISGTGRTWFYEWYPSGYLDVQYAGYYYPGWYKRWFFADTPGWHILQYYCNGWSNFVYIYVYGGGPGYWTGGGSYQPPYPTPYPTPYPGSGSQTFPLNPASYGNAKVILRSNWLKGYNVFVDGSYVGKEGVGNDPLDGTYNLEVPGNRQHSIKITKGSQSYDETGTFQSGITYRLTI